MNHLETTGADIAHSASIMCNDDVVMSLSGTALMPGSQYAKEQIGKQVRIQLFGTKGAIFYEGDDAHPSSGKLVFRSPDGTAEILEDSFAFESIETCPESVEQFVQLCASSKTNEEPTGKKEDNKNPNCSNAMVGLRTVQTLEAMYRSHASQSLVDVTVFSDEENP